MKFFKSFFTFGLLTGSLVANDLSDYLIQEKKDVLKYEWEKSNKNSTKNKYSWIRDVNVLLNSSIDNNDNKNMSAGIYFEQEVFKGGNIYTAMEYADTLQRFERDNILIEKEQYKNNILKILLSLESLKIDQENIELQLQNNKVDYEKKLELYHSGLLNISFISDSIISKNNILNLKVDIENSINSLNKDLSTLTDTSAKEFLTTIDLFEYIKVLTKEEFMNQNFIQSKKKNIELKKMASQLSKGEMLPSVSVFMNHEYMKKIEPISMNDTYSSAGIKIKIPLSVNKYNDYEVAQKDYLLENSKFKDNLVAEEAFYDKKIVEIEYIYKKIKNIESSIQEYDNLINNLKNDVDIGLTVASDLEILKINKKIKVVEKRKLLNKIQQISLEIQSKTIGRNDV